MFSSSICKRSLLFHVNRRKQGFTTGTDGNACSSRLYWFPLWNLSPRSISDYTSESTAAGLSSSSSSSSFTVSYLMDSWGLSQNAAVRVAEKVQVKDAFKPDIVLKLLKDNGFTKTQIAAMAVKRPELVASNARATLKPKIEFFKRMGLVGPDLTKVISSNPSILCCRLDTKIKTSYDFLKSILVADENIVFALKRDPWLLHCNLPKLMAPNVDVLRSLKMPDSRISKLLMRQPKCLMRKPDQFVTLIDDLKEMGYDPKDNMFIYALPAISGMSNALWNKKVKVYRSFGWSDDEILTAFRRHPDFILKSEERIREVMDFAMNKLHLKPEKLMRYPTMFTYSLEKTIIPRCSVLNILMSRGILANDINVLAKLHLSKDRFFDRYVVTYQDEVPEVLEAYEGKIAFESFGS